MPAGGEGTVSLRAAKPGGRQEDVRDVRRVNGSAPPCSCRTFRRGRRGLRSRAGSPKSHCPVSSRRILASPRRLPVSSVLTVTPGKVTGLTSLGSTHESICGKGLKRGLARKALRSDDIDRDDWGNRPLCSTRGWLCESQDFTLLEKSLLIFYYHH